MGHISQRMAENGLSSGGICNLLLVQARHFSGNAIEALIMQLMKELMATSCAKQNNMRYQKQ